MLIVILIKNDKNAFWSLIIETLHIYTLPLKRPHCEKYKGANYTLEHPLIKL